MTVLRSFIFQIAFFAWTALVSIAYVPLLVLPRRVMIVASNFWGRVTLALLAIIVGLDYQVRGRDRVPDGPVIYALKHQSAWDTIVIVTLFRNPVIVLKRELFAIPCFGWHLWKIGSIAVDREGGAGALKRLVAVARARSAAGGEVIMFPEGTRTAPGTRRPYQPGIAAVYRALGVPVVPVALNSGLFWGRRALLKRPGRIAVEFLPPIPPGLPRPDFMAALEDRIETATDALNEEAANRFGVAPEHSSTD